MSLALPWVEHREQARLGQTLGALHRRSDDAQRTTPRYTAPNLSPLCQFGHEKDIHWFNPICSVHRLTLLPSALVIMSDFRSCQLVVPHQHLLPARSRLPPLSASPPHLALSSHLENDFTILQETRCSECSGKAKKKTAIDLPPVKYKALNVNSPKKSPPQPSEVGTIISHFT